MMRFEGNPMKFASQTNCTCFLGAGEAYSFRGDCRFPILEESSMLRKRSYDALLSDRSSSMNCLNCLGFDV